MSETWRSLGKLKRLRHRNAERGLTLVELIVTVAILAIVASAAVPVTRFEVKRAKERELRYDLWTMRDAIDKYKDAADKGAKGCSNNPASFGHQAGGGQS